MISSLHAIAELLSLRLLDSLVEGTLVCLLMSLLFRLTPRQNAATRFRLWFSVLIAIAVLPWVDGAFAHAGLSVSATHHAAVTLPHSWALYLLAVWSAMVIWFVMGLVRAMWHLSALRRDRVPVDAAELDPTLLATLQRCGGSRRIALCTSSQVRVPTAVGLFKPTILIPGWVIRELSSAELNQVLLHELAHFRRWDDWTNLAQQIVKAVFFFHPAVWWIDKRIAAEREIACDDAVLAETRSPRAYAECLAHLAEKSFVNRSIALVQAALGKVRQTSARIAEILDVNRPSPTSRPWISALSLVVILSLACCLFYSRTPRLVAFGNAEHSPQPASFTVQMHSNLQATTAPIDHVTQAKFDLPATRTKLKAATLDRRSPHLRPVQVLQPRLPKTTQDENLVHVTRFTSATVPFSETFWVVVESEGTNRAAPRIYQIQMWRVTVVRTVMSTPNRRVSRGET
jgi:beta-lactamase regulating signal transducer with metallopeptidase domain